MQYLLLFAVILLPLCFLGYGSDNDTYGVLEAGRSTWHLHIPETSRPPGYLIYEAIVYVLSTLGGYIASNLATLAVALVALWRFLVIAGRLDVRFPGLVAACLVAAPVFAIASTSTDDYVWSLLGIVVFAEILVADRLALAILPAAFAFALRGANGLVVAGGIAGAVASELCRHRRITRRALLLVGVGLAAALLGSPPYIESYRLAGHSLQFADALAGPAEMWTAKMRVGRFLYKGLYLFGPLAWLLLAIAMFTNRDRPAPNHALVADYRSRAVPVFAGIVLLNAALFFWFPIEYGYLIPGTFFLLLLLGTTLLAKRRALTIVFLAAIVASNLVTLQLAQPNFHGHATNASIHPAVRAGFMVDDVQSRVGLRHCDDLTCWYLYAQQHGLLPQIESQP
jgi:hypothetical protein